CGLELPLDDAQKLVRSALDVVVDDHVVELVLLLQLALRSLEPLLDLPTALRRPRPEPALELRERRRLHEDRRAVVDLALDRERPLGLEGGARSFPRRADPGDLRPQRPGALSPFEVDVLEELARFEPPLELLARDEVVVASFLLALAALARRRRDGELELGDARKDGAFECSLAGTRRAGYDDDRLTG